MEVWITEFRNNSSAYFDQVFFQKEEIVLTRRGHRVKIVNIDEDEENFDNAVKSDFIRNKFRLLAKAL